LWECWGGISTNLSASSETAFEYRTAFPSYRYLLRGGDKDPVFLLYKLSVWRKLRHPFSVILDF